MKIRIVNNSNNPLPEYATLASAGADLRANLEHDIQLKPMERTMVPTGIFIEIPRGHEAQIRPRSGLAVKKGVTVLNSPGTIDADYRGEVKIILINLSNETTTIKPGERIAQMIISRHEQAEWVETDELDKTQRGTGGFGSTGQD